ncbi:MAG: class I SAM-dependent methyltransferase [Planctomycetes bacterium]|nr:class I SAM-dependent methyltransferase [Planctomycetota bacterium]
MRFLSVLCIHGYQPTPNATASHREAARRWGANLLYIYEASWPEIHPYTEKLRLNLRFPDGSRVIAIDGDMLIRHDCPNLFEIVGDKFAAVRHHATTRWWVRPHGRIDAFTEGAGLEPIDERRDYVHGGLYAFSVPEHDAIFERARQLDDAQENPSKDSWEISDQLPLSLAMREHSAEVLWLPTTFNRCQMYEKRHTEMEHFIEHYCFWDRDRTKFMLHTNWEHSTSIWHCEACRVRRFEGKPVSWFGDEIHFFIRELCELPLDARMVEIGSHVGGSAWYGGRHVQSLDGEYWCIDTWESSETCPNSDQVFDSFQLNMRESGLEGFVKPLRMKSVDAARLFDDGSLDCVFIDGDHSYENVIEDIRAWHPKLKPGGVMLGHDYSEQHWPGVCQAVNECFGRRIAISEQGGGIRMWKATGPLSW